MSGVSPQLACIFYNEPRPPGPSRFGLLDGVFSMCKCTSMGGVVASIGCCVLDVWSTL